MNHYTDNMCGQDKLFPELKRSKTDKWRRKNNVVAKTPNSITVVVQVKHCLPVTKSSAPLWMGAVSNPTDRV